MRPPQRGQGWASATAVIGDRGVGAVLAAGDVSAEGRRAAALDHQCRVSTSLLRKRQRSDITVAMGQTMKSPPFSMSPTFLGTSWLDRTSPICVAGIPLDLGTTYRSGARFGPTTIRLASHMLADGQHPEHWTDATSLQFADSSRSRSARRPKSWQPSLPTKTRSPPATSRALSAAEASCSRSIRSQVGPT
jgi:Arginase family